MKKDKSVVLELTADLQENITPKLQKIDKGLEKTTEEAKKLDDETKKLGEQAGHTEPPLTNLPKGLESNAGTTKIKVDSLKKSIASLGSVSKYAFAGIVASAGVAVKKYMDLEAGVLKVRTISGKSFDGIKKSAQDLAVKYGISTSQILEGNYQLVSSMGDVAQAQEVLDTTAKLSIAGFTSYESAMNGLVAVLNGYKMSATEASKVADVLMTVQNRGITTVNELQASLSEVTSIAYNANVGFKDIAAALATITSNKVGTAEAVTGLKGAILELMQDGTQASKLFKQATGEAFDVFMENHSLVDAIQSLNDYAKSANISLTNVFGNVRAGTSFMNLAGDNLKKFNEDLLAMNKAAGTADKAMEELDKGGARALAKLKEQANVATQEIGEALIPKVKELTDKLADVNWKEVFSEKNIDLIVRTATRIGVVTGAVWALSKAVTTVETSIKAISLAKAGLTFLGGGSAVAGAGVLSVGALGAYGAYKGYERNLESQNDKINKSVSRLNNEGKEQYYQVELDKSNKKIETLKKEVNRARGKRQEKINFELLREQDRVKALTEQYEKLKKSYSNDGYLSAPRGSKIEIKDKKNDNKTNGKTVKVESEEIKNFRAELDKFYQNQPKIWELLGFNEQQKLEEKVSFLKSAIKKSVELGATSLTPKLKKELDEASNSLTLKIKKINLDEAKKELEEKLNTIKGDGIVNLGKTGIDKDKAEYNAITEFLDIVEKNGFKLDKQLKDELESKQNRLKEAIQVDNKKLKADKDYAEKVKETTQLIEGIQSLGAGISQIGAATGSQTTMGIGSIIGSVGSIATQAGKVSSSAITGMFSGAEGAMSAGLTSLGAAAGVAAAGIGIALTINSMMAARGKKQKAKIDARNKENEGIYKKQVSAMEQLTKAIQANSERIKAFSDRMLTDMAKNPTLTALKGGNFNYESLSQYMNEGKQFGAINALEKGRKRYSKGWGRHGHKDTYTNVQIETDKILKDLGFDKSNVNLFSIDEMKQLDSVLDQVNHSRLRKVTGRDLTESNIEEWKKQIHEFVAQVKYLEQEQKELFKGATLESFTGVEYREEKELLKEYTEQFKQMGLVGEQYNSIIKEMAKNNQVLITSMQDVRATTIENFMTGQGNFLTSTKSYFEKIYKNASSVVYDVAFSDIDRYMSEAFEGISNKLVDIKNSGKLDFSNLLTGFDFSILVQADATQKQAKKSLDVLKEQLLNSGIDLSIINQILPSSDFNNRINEFKNSLSNAMSSGLQEHSFLSFTKTLGESMYESTKSALVKAFSESNLYQGMIQKFIKAEDFQAQLDKAGSFKEAFKLSESIMKKFGYEMEAAGFGGFDAINNKAEEKVNLGNAYYTDRQNTVNINITNNFNREVYGIEDFKGVIRETTKSGIQEFMNRPKVLIS